MKLIIAVCICLFCNMSFCFATDSMWKGKVDEQQASLVVNEDN